ncbi:MAG: alpha-galactosidase [Verrucomicrobiota bacterium]
MHIRDILAVAAFVGTLLSKTCTAVDFPGPPPGPPAAEVTGHRVRLQNQVLSAEWRVDGKTLRMTEFVNRISGERVTGNSQELFAIAAPPLTLKSSDFTLEDSPKVVEVRPEPKAARVSERSAGRAIVARLLHAGSGVVVEWRGELRANSHYVRQVLTLQGPAQSGTIRHLELLNVQAPQAAVVGEVPGSPVVAGQTFLGVELPMCSPKLSGDVVHWQMDCAIRWDAQHPCQFGSVIGVLPAGQARRAFLAYLERERAREPKPFLHYNCWYDLGCDMTEKDLLKVVAIFEKKLIRERGIRLDAFVLDDGWDNLQAGFWTVDTGKFPAGFDGPCRELERVGSHLGIWISPLGGYGNERLQLARKAGIVSAGAGLDLDQPVYYDWWLNYCSDLMRKHGVNYFKWDNAANFTSLARIAGELRKIDPTVFINTTVNTFPSPFFLNSMDATWRGGGGDCGWFGPGNSREQYITFRDKELYACVVRQAPLYPLNSIMHCAPVLGRKWQAKDIAVVDMKNDCRALFGMGSILQELYISPDLMQDSWWDQLAEAIRWAHTNSGVLADAHWIGGDPGKLEVYGCAAWSPRKGTLMLRNPSDKKASATLDIAKVFELPTAAAQSYGLVSPYPDQRVQKQQVLASKPFTLEMDPFEVLVFDALPTTARTSSSVNRGATDKLNRK